MSASKHTVDISVWMTSYYHEAYVAQALDSILEQETDYSFEIVICDDCSQDRTWEIITEYANKYPDLIRAKRNEVNLGLTKNVLSAKMMCSGKYIVNLSGDDYWIDKHKIQMQADFLETHTDFVGVGTIVECRYENLDYAAWLFPKKELHNREYTLSDYERGRNFPSHGNMLRNFFIDAEKREEIQQVYAASQQIDDIYDPVLFLRYGRLFILPKATCVYRMVIMKNDKHNFNSVSTTLKKTKMLMSGYLYLHEICGEQVNLRMRFTSTMNLAILNALKSMNFKGLRELYRSIPVEYRKPWRDSVMKCCMLTIFPAGRHYLQGRLRARRAMKEIEARK